MNNFDVFSNKFSHDIFLQKYSMNGTETWEDLSKRVVSSVCGQLLSKEDQEEIFKIINSRKFIPGGRYLYSSGRSFHQVNNCVLFRAEDSREGWADLMQKATASLMSGAGIGVDYSALREAGALIKRTGGVSTGPISLMNMVNEAGRHIMQGGQRRSAIWAGLQWDHKDIHTFMNLKNHSKELMQAKEKDLTFNLPMELTNISVIYNTEFFVAIDNINHPKHLLAKDVWAKNCLQAFSTAEPGFSFNFRKDAESLRNACVPGYTEILTKGGYNKIEDLVGQEVEVWNGFEWSKVTPKVTGKNQPLLNITFNNGIDLDCTVNHKFHIATTYHGDTSIVEAKDLRVGMKLIKHEFPIIESGIKMNKPYTNGFVAAEGMELDKTVYVYPPKEKCISRLEGVRIKKWEPNNKRYRIVLEETPLSKSLVPLEYDLSSKLEWLAGLFDGDGTELKEGGLQLCSVNLPFLYSLQKLLSTLGVSSKVVPAAKAGMRSMPNHKGGNSMYYCQDSYRICVGAVQMQQLKKLGLKCERLDFNKTPQRDASQFVTVTNITENGVADMVYCFNEPKRHLGIFNGILTGQCTEVVSEDDSDKCNLGTVWINRIKDTKELRKVVKYSTLFLLCGGVYSDVPTAKIKEVGNKNNRIGLGLGGMHEWLMNRGCKYEVTPELHKWLAVYKEESDNTAYIKAKELGVAIPKGVRAIAPTGSIGILAESTTGIEPLFCKAYKRRYFKAGKWFHQFVVDGSVKRLLDSGVKVENIQDSYDITFKERVKFQADVQNYVDMSISSTCNLPKWGASSNNEQNLPNNSEILLKYAKRLRGFTCYPDESRGGQPLTRVSLEEALKSEGTVFEEAEVECVGGVCGI